MKVQITVLQSVRRTVGWSTREVQTGAATLAELLREVPADEGRSLYDLLADGERRTHEYFILLNGMSVSSRGTAGLDVSLVADDKVVVMDIIPVIAGG